MDPKEAVKEAQEAQKASEQAVVKVNMPFDNVSEYEEARADESAAWVFYRARCADLRDNVYDIYGITLDELRRIT